MHTNAMVKPSFDQPLLVRLVSQVCLTMQVSKKLHAAELQLQKLQGIISTDMEAEACLSSLLDRLHRRFVGLVHAKPEVSAGDHKAKELHIAPRVNEMFVGYMDEVASCSTYYANT